MLFYILFANNPLPGLPPAHWDRNHPNSPPSPCQQLQKLLRYDYDDENDDDDDDDDKRTNLGWMQDE